MKTNRVLVLSLSIMLALGLMSASPVHRQANENSKLVQLSAEQVLSLSTAELEANGHKLTALQKLQLNIAQKIVAKKVKKAEKQSSGMSKGVYILVAFFIPFLAVGIATNFKGSDWVIALLLSLLFWLPGFIYALVKMKDYY
jgi:uncharacterized membrane protein YqaE (UPF0057 family)